MSTEPQAIEEMDRDELEEELADLRERVGRLEDVATVVTKLVNQLNDTDGDDEFLTTFDEEYVPEGVAAVQALAETVQDHDNTIDRLDSTVKESRSATGSTDDSNWWDVVDAAHNLKNDADHGLPNNQVKLYRENIAQATGLSKKRGQQLIDEWTQEESSKYKQGTTRQKYQNATPANNNEEQRKAIIIDLDVWEDSE
jgi:hypothetical protein